MHSTTDARSGVTTITYLYDNESCLTGATDGNSLLTYSYESGGVLVNRYLYGLAVDELLARTSSGGTSAWYLTDQLGTVRDIVNTSGTVIDHLSYDSFGTELTESSAANGDRFKYTGREYNSETGDYYYRAREYSPTMGRFERVDPMGFAAGQTNLFCYVANSPLLGVDPTGLLGDMQTATPRAPTQNLADMQRQANDYLRSDPFSS